MSTRCLFALSLLFAAACAPEDTNTNLSSEADASAQSNNGADESDAIEDSSPDLTGADDAPDGAPDGAPEEIGADIAPDDAPEPPAPEGQRCGDLLVQATVGEEHRQEDGTFRLPALRPQGALLTNQCPVSDPSVSAGREVFVAFEAPTAGSYTFEAQGSTQLSLWSSCSLDGAPLECSWFVHHHDSRFSAPRLLTRAMAQGERTWIGMDTVTSGEVALTIHTPLVEGQPCATDPNAWFNRACGDATWCGRPTPEAELECLPKQAPVLSRAVAHREGDRLFVAAWGEDQDQNAAALRVMLLDARGDALPLPGGAPALEIWGTTAQWDGPSFGLKGAWAPYDTWVTLPAGAVTARVWAHDRTDAESAPLEVALTPRPRAPLGSACDAARIEDVCALGGSCLPEGDAHRCGELAVSAHTTPEGWLHLRAQADGGQDDARLYLLASPDATRPLAEAGEVSFVDQVSAWERKLRYNALIYFDWQPGPWYVAVGHPSGAWDEPRLLEPSPLPVLSAQARCDGDRIGDRCGQGLACLRPDPAATPWRCEAVVAPLITSARGFTNGQSRGGSGLLLEGEDPNRDVTSLLVQTLNADGSSSGDAREELLRWRRDGHLRWEGDRFWLSWSRSWGAGGAVRVWVLDGEGRASAPVDVRFAEAPLEAAQGEPCDVYGQWSLCGEGLACDRLRDDARGHTCHALEEGCPDAWPVTTIAPTRGQRAAQVTGDLREGAPLTLTCDAQALARDQVFRFVAPEAASYRVHIQSDAYIFPRLSLRSACALPVEGALACYEIVNDRGGNVYADFFASAGEEVFMVVHFDPLEARPTPFTLSLTW